MAAEPVATNALERQTLEMYRDWFAWLRRAGVPGFMGEHSVPNSEKGWTSQEIAKWLTLFDLAYQTLDANADVVPVVTAHAASHSSFDKGGLRIYVPTSTSGTMAARNWGRALEQAPVVERHPGTAARLRGMNAASGAMKDKSDFGARNPGVYGTEYVYPDAADYSYLLSRGLNVTRLPFRWERIQTRTASSPNASPALKATEVERLRASLDAAASVGMKVIPSLQNYGDYIFSTSLFGSSKAEVGSSGLSISAYANFWKMLASGAKGHPAIVGYDIMNEPGNLQGGALQWERASQAAVDAIASVDTNTRIWVSGYHTRHGDPGETYNGLYSFIENHPAPWISSPTAKFGYTSHVYYGPGAAFKWTYDEAVALWEGRGYGG